MHSRHREIQSPCKPVNHWPTRQNRKITHKLLTVHNVLYYRMNMAKKQPTVRKWKTQSISIEPELLARAMAAKRAERRHSLSSLFCLAMEQYLDRVHPSTRATPSES